ncbi:MAG: InlB B-repeat-containing protein [Sporichthyaceae bacterium]
MRPRRGRRTTASALAFAMVAGAVSVIAVVAAAPPASAAVGDALFGKLNPDGCHASPSNGAVTGTPPICTVGRATTAAQDVAASPDGRFVYVGGNNTGNGGIGIAIFKREADGRLTQLPGEAGCITQAGLSDAFDGSRSGCATDPDVFFVTDLVVSPDGKHLYVGRSQRLLVFDRNLDTGVLTRKAGAGGCVSAGTPSPPDSCTGPAPGLGEQPSLAMPSDGSYLAVASSAGVQFLTREATGGTLTVGQCFGPQAGCSPLPSGNSFVRGVAVSPDGSSVYAAATNESNGFLLTFARGSETPPFTRTGCIATAASTVCVAGRGLARVVAVAVSPDGSHVYSATQFGDLAVAVFNRGTGGALTQKDAEAGCISGLATPPTDCAANPRLAGLQTLAMAHDGSAVLVGTFGTGGSGAGSGGVGIFDRNSTDGTLVEKRRLARCLRDGAQGAQDCATARAIGQTSDIVSVPPADATTSPSAEAIVADSVYVTAAVGVAVLDRLPASILTLTTTGAVGSGTVRMFRGTTSTQQLAGCTLGGGTSVSPNPCDLLVPTGTTQRLEIFPPSGQVLRTSTGCTVSPCMETISGDTTIEVRFGTPRTVTVTPAGPGTGRVDGSGFDCSTPAAAGDVCTQTVLQGDSVTLAAAPTGGSSFAGFAGPDGCTDQTCMFTVGTANVTVGASFTAAAPNTATVTIMPTGNGSGTVTGPSGPNCVYDSTNATGCVVTLPLGQVNLTATAGALSTFTGFSNACTGETCSFQLTAAGATVGAEFALDPPSGTLTVALTGAGTGSVTSVPDGISCAAPPPSGDCTETVTESTTFTLTAVAGSGSRFAGWSGCDSTAGKRCTVTVNGTDATVRARFEPAVSLPPAGPRCSSVAKDGDRAGCGAQTRTVQSEEAGR